MSGWFIPSLRDYRAAWLSRDLVAGVMLAAIAIPEQLATARLAGMPPETGLYAFAAGSLAFAVLGAYRFMSVGADSTIAPIFAGGLATMAVAGSANYADLAAWLALLVGIVLVLVGLARAGWLATLLSIPVTTGFLAGISIHIIVGQLPTLLGISDEQGELLARLVHIVGRVGETNRYALALGGTVLLATWAAHRISARVPGALIGMIAAGIAVALFHLQDRGADVLGPLAFHLPTVALPSTQGARELAGLVPLALIVAMVCMMQTVAVARSFPAEEGRYESVGRNFAAVGAGCILAGLTGAFAVDSSPPRTALLAESGSRSQLASIVAVILIGAVALLAASLLAYVPEAALSGVLVYIALRIFRLREMVQIYRRGGQEILLVAASAGMVIAFPIETGMLLAIVLSFLHSLYIVARPLCAELARVPGSTVWWPPSVGEKGEHEPGVLVFAPAAPLDFTNAEYICEKMMAALAAKEPVKLLVIEASGIIDIDYTGSHILRRTIADLHERHVDVALARLSDERAQLEARRSGLIEMLGPNRVFKSVEEAVRAIGRTNGQELE